MSIGEKVRSAPPWIWKLITAVGTLAGLAVSATQLSDWYWQKVDDLVKGSVTQSAIEVTTELKKTERSLGRFLVDDIEFRIIGVQDEIGEYRRMNKQIPIYLERKLELLEDQLEEAKEKWDE
jgi:hypothetical protein